MRGRVNLPEGHREATRICWISSDLLERHGEAMCRNRQRESLDWLILPVVPSSQHCQQQLHRSSSGPIYLTDVALI